MTRSSLSRGRGRELGFEGIDAVAGFDEVAFDTGAVVAEPLPLVLLLETRGFELRHAAARLVELLGDLVAFRRPIGDGEFERIDPVVGLGELAVAFGDRFVARGDERLLPGDQRAQLGDGLVDAFDLDCQLACALRLGLGLVVALCQLGFERGDALLQLGMGGVDAGRILAE